MDFHPKVYKLFAGTATDKFWIPRNDLAHILVGEHKVPFAPGDMSHGRRGSKCRYIADLDAHRPFDLPTTNDDLNWFALSFDSLYCGAPRGEDEESNEDETEQKSKKRKVDDSPQWIEDLTLSDSFNLSNLTLEETRAILNLYEIRDDSESAQQLYTDLFAHNPSVFIQVVPGDFEFTETPKECLMYYAGFDANMTDDLVEAIIDFDEFHFPDTKYLVVKPRETDYGMQYHLIKTIFPCKLFSCGKSFLTIVPDKDWYFGVPVRGCTDKDLLTINTTKFEHSEELVSGYVTLLFDPYQLSHITYKVKDDIFECAFVTPTEDTDDEGITVESIKDKYRIVSLETYWENGGKRMFEY